MSFLPVISGRHTGHFEKLPAEVLSAFYLALGTIYVCRGVLNGIGDAGFSLINGIVEVIGRIGFPLLLMLFPAIGVWGIWLSAGLTWFISGLFSLIRYIVKTRSVSFLALASNVRAQELGSKAKVTAISKKAC